MNKNLGTVDRVIRIVIAISLCFLLYFKIIKGNAAVPVIIIVFFLLLNTFSGSCGIYSIFGFSTKKSCAYNLADKKKKLKEGAIHE